MEPRSVHDKLMGQKKMLAVAESCTGGLLMATLTQFAGASNYLVGGVVAYSNEMKKKLLAVSPKTLDRFGAVSSEVVIEMVAGLFIATNADIGISVSGSLGPTGEKIGTVWMAIGERGKKIRSEQIPLKTGNSRLEYREQVLSYLLEALWNL